MARYISVYPPAYDSTYVKATHESGWYSVASLAADPSLSMIDGRNYVSWIAGGYGGGGTNMRFHIDLGVMRRVKRIYYQNGHDSGNESGAGPKDFTFWGSNTAAAFAELTYATDTNWTQITTAQTTFDRHVASNQVDPKYIAAANLGFYRYYAFKFANAWDNTVYMNVRRIELQIMLFTPQIISF